MATVSELTSKNIASAQANVQTWGGVLLNVKVYGAKGDGVTDCSAQVQEAVNYCLANGLRLYFPKGTYLIGTPVLINYDTVTTWTDFSIEGSHVKSAYSDLVRNEGTIIKTNGNDAFVFTPQYPCGSINIKRIHGFNSSGSDSGTLFKIDMGLMISSQLKTLWVDEVTAYNFENVFYFFNDADASLRNLPYTSINRLYTYSCASSIKLSVCVTTIFKLNDTLIHGATAGGFVFPGGEFQFDNVWFEGCEPAGIVKSSTTLAILSLKDTYFESSGKVSGAGAWTLNDNTYITIVGRSNLPGAQSMPAPILPKYCFLSAYTNSGTSIKLKLNGGIVFTPETVRLDLTYGNYGFYPVSCAVLPERGTRVNNSFSGGFQGGFGTPSGNTPPTMENDYTWAENAFACDIRGSLGTEAVDRVLVSSFIWYVTSGNSIGLGTESYLTIDGVNVILNQGYVQTASESLEGYVCVVTQPIAANEDVTRLTLQTRNDIDVSLAYTNFQPATGSGAKSNLAKLGHPQTKKYIYNQTIATAANYVFLEKFASTKPYAIKATLILNGGLDGTIIYSLYGKAVNLSKYRDVISGASKNADIAVTAADGANLDMFNITVANTTGASITAKLIVEY